MGNSLSTNFGQSPVSPSSVRFELNFSLGNSFSMEFGPMDMANGFLAQYAIIDNSAGSSSASLKIGPITYDIAPFETAGFPVVMNALDSVVLSSSGTAIVRAAFSNALGGSFSRFGSDPANEKGYLKTISEQLPVRLNGFRLETVSAFNAPNKSGTVALGTVSAQYVCGPSTFCLEMYCRVGQARWEVGPAVPTSASGNYIGVGERVRYAVAPNAVLNLIQSADAALAGFIEINECN